MQKKQVSVLVATLFATAGVAHAAGGADFVDRGNPNQVSKDCIDGTRASGCIGTRVGDYVASSDKSYTAGNGSQAGTGGIAIGDRSNANYKNVGNATSNGGATAIGVGAQAVNNSAMALGAVAVASGNTAIAMGRQSAATGNFATAIGNVSNAAGERSVALGHSAQASGDQAIAIGSSAGTKGDGVSPGAFYDGETNTQANGKRSLAIGSGARTDGADQVAIGANSVGANANTTKTFGEVAPAGGAVTFGKIGAARQLKNVAAGADDTDAVNVAQVKNVQSGLSTAIGAVDQRVTNVDNRVTTVSNSLSTSINNTNNNLTSLSTATNTSITNLTSSLSTTNVNLSSLSTSVTNIGTQVTQNTNNITALQEADKLNVKYDGLDKKSVTLGGADGTIISNVKAGSKDTDAVNVGQLKPLQTSITNINTSLSTATSNITNLQGDVKTINTNVSNVTERVTTVEGNVSDLTQVVNGHTINITELQEADKRNVKYDGATGFDSVTLRGGPNGTKLTNVAAGEVSKTSTDAINGSQLYETEQKIKDGVSGDLKNVVKYDGDDHTSITLGNAGAPVSITNVARGELSATSTAAVNGSQLFETNQNVKQQGDLITNIDGRVTSNTNNIDSLKQDALQFNASIGAYDAMRGGSATKISGVAAGDLSATSTDAVNGSQLHTTNQNVLNLTEAVNKQGDTISNIDNSVNGLKQDALLWNKDLNAFDASHGSGTAQRISNVAAGEKGTDAVNVDQLNKAVENVGNAVSKGYIKYDQNVDGSINYGSITLGGNQNILTQVHNVAAGVADTDAVNVGQLKQAKTDITKEVTNNVTQWVTDNKDQFKGDKGDKGDTGAAGPAGKDGEQGPKGDKGDTGAVVSQPQVEPPANMATQDDIARVNQSLTGLRNDMNALKKDMNAGVAAAMAVAALPQPNRPGENMVALGTATYQGQQGFALGISRVTSNDKWVLKGAVTSNTRGAFGAAFGAGYKF